MTYKSILLNLDLDAQAVSVIKFATDLAKRFDARLIGLAAAAISPPFVAADGVAFDADIMLRQREYIEGRLEELRKELEGVAGAAVDLEWRGALSNPTGLLVDSARAADLIVTTSPKGASIGDAQRAVDLGNLVLQAGRPILVASTGEEHFLTNNVLVAWKDTREARRAVADAIPILQMAKEVRIITIDKAATDDTWKSLRDVAAFVSHHGVKAATEVLPEQSDGHMIADLANAMNADMIISGAYGHSRLREWIFGGATRSLLEDDRLNRFMSN